MRRPIAGVLVPPALPLVLGTPSSAFPGTTLQPKSSLRDRGISVLFSMATKAMEVHREVSRHFFIIDMTLGFKVKSKRRRAWNRRGQGRSAGIASPQHDRERRQSLSSLLRILPGPDVAATEESSQRSMSDMTSRDSITWQHRARSVLRHFAADALSTFWTCRRFVICLSI